MPHLYRIGSLELNIERGELLRHDSESTETIHLPPQLFRVLECLVKKAGQLVSREDLSKTIWQEEVFVDQNLGLNHCIRRLRRILRDDAQHPSYIQTVPKRGYRFIADVEAEPNVSRRDNIRVELQASQKLNTNGNSSSGPIAIGVLPFRTYSPVLTYACFGDSLAEEVLRESFQLIESDHDTFILHQLVCDSLKRAASAPPDLYLTGSARIEDGYLRILAYLIRAWDNAVLRTSTWQGDGELISLDTQLRAVRHLVETLFQGVRAGLGATTPHGDRSAHHVPP